MHNIKMNLLRFSSSSATSVVSSEDMKQKKKKIKTEWISFIFHPLLTMRSYYPNQTAYNGWRFLTPSYIKSSVFF